MKSFHPLTSTLGAVALFAVGMVLGLGNLSGCGKKSPDDPEADSTSWPDSKAAATPKKNDNGATKPRKRPADRKLATTSGRKRGVYTDENGQKWWNKHPYDVWYKDAYEIAGDQTRIGSGKPANNGGTKVAKKDTPKTGMNGGKTPMPKAGGTDWKSLAEMPVLEAEVKSIRNFLTQKMRTPASYRQDYKKIQYSGATLAALAQVMAKHPGKLTWKGDALYVRDLGLAINEKAIGLGAKEFRATQTPYLQLIDTLNRSRPAGLKDPSKDATFFDFADRGALMQRMKQAHNWLDKEVNTAEKIKSEAERVVQEATILAVLLKVIGDPSYDSADAPQYKEHVRVSIENAQKIKGAVKTGNFDGFRKSLSTIYNRCNECHNRFR